jgi:hypothetical protein
MNEKAENSTGKLRSKQIQNLVYSSSASDRVKVSVICG